jgi:obg-like ATPase 1
MPPKKKKGGEESERVPLLGRSTNNVGMGIVGMPNVGKSTFFNTLSKLHVPAENYAFCTKDPNVAKVPVKDKRFDKLVAAFAPKSVKPAVLTVTDIAGLVRGAAEGAGLGNEFLSHIRATDAIYHMVRAFEDKDISHVEESVDPIRDMDIIENELRAKDLEGMVNYVEKEAKNVARGIGGKEKKFEFDTFVKVKELLESGKDVRSARWSAKETPIINTKQFLTAKPMIYLVNLKADSYVKKRSNWLPKILAYVEERGLGEPVIPVSAAYESMIVDAELAGPEEVAKIVAENDGVESLLPKVIKLGYKTLNMQSFFTCGPDEVRQWSIRKGFTAPEAAGTIHGDFQKCFISADIYKFKDWNKVGGTREAEAAVKAAGKLKTEGKKYIMQDGDICFFKHNASK